jgi:hypothetical protein
MRQPHVIGLLGAEKQAASSAAVTWPDRRFIFVSDQRVLDGWDLPNVRFAFARPDELSTLPVDEFIPLCPRWLDPALSEPMNRLSTFRLSAVMAELELAFPEFVLPVRTTRAIGGAQIVKGDARHRPDAAIHLGLTCGQTTSRLPDPEIEDPQCCGVLFQPYLSRARTVLATGRCWAEGVQLAVAAIHVEACARDEVLQAGETIAHAFIAEKTLAVLERLGHRGFFTCNWVQHEGRAWLTSVRPVPRALFGTILRAGLDLLVPPTRQGIQIARAGCKFVVTAHHSSYKALCS